MAEYEVNIKEQAKDTDYSDKLIEFLEDQWQKVEKDIDARTEWKRKLITNNNQRMGIKRVSLTPYPGAPNIPLPEADKLIQKKKPQYILSIVTPKKKAFVRIAEGVRETPELKEKVRKAELGFNYVINNKLDLFNTLDLAADTFLEKGHCIIKVYEKFSKSVVHKIIDLDDYPKEVVKQLRQLRIRDLKRFISERYELNIDDDDDNKIINDIVDQFKMGKRVIEFDLPVVESWPDIVNIPPEKITPPPYAHGVDSLERFTEEYYLTKRELIEGAENGVYSKAIIDKIDDLEIKGQDSNSSENDLIDSSKEINEGVIENTNDELFLIQDLYTWYKPEGSDCYERWVFTRLANTNNLEQSLLRAIRYPYEFGSWNIVKHDNEVKDSRWHASRGLPEQTRALQEFQEKAINNMLIRDEINNSPIFTVLSNSRLKQNSLRFVPGQRLPVQDHNEIARLDNSPKVDVSSERVHNLLKAIEEEYVGATDQLFRNATNEGGGKTLGEIKLGVQLASAQASVDVARWILSIKKVYTLVYELLKERMGESIFLEGMEITREDFNIPVEIIPNGSIDLTSEALKLNKAMARLQMVSSLIPAGIATQEDLFNAAVDLFELDGVKDPNRYLTHPNIIAQANQQALQQEDAVLAQQEQGITQEINQKRAALAAAGVNEDGPNKSGQ